jgi:hypothetical protein
MRFVTLCEVRVRSSHQSIVGGELEVIGALGRYGRSRLSSSEVMWSLAMVPNWDKRGRLSNDARGVEILRGDSIDSEQRGATGKEPYQSRIRTSSRSSRWGRGLSGLAAPNARPT